MKLFTVLGILFVVSTSFAQLSDAKSDSAMTPPQESALKNSSSYLLCKSGIAVRTLRIEHKGQNCRAVYTKEGVDQLVGKSIKPDGCVESISKIQHILENAKWACRDISQTRVSASAD